MIIGVNHDKRHNMLIGDQDPLMDLIMNEFEAMRTEEEREIELVMQEEIEDIRETELARKEANEKEKKWFLTVAKVKPYSGQKNPRKLETFAADVLHISKDFNLDDSELITVALRNLRGRAQSWCFEHVHPNKAMYNDFTKFIQILKQQFCREYDRQFHVARLLELRQHGKVKTFNDQFSTLLKDLPPQYQKSELILDIYLSQLKSNIRTEVKYQNPTGLGSAMRFALTYDKQFNNSESCSNKHSFKRDDEKFNMKKRDRENLAKKLRCYNCDEKGPFAAKCSRINRK